MPRYLVERTFPAGPWPLGDAVLDAHAQRGVTWLHSYVTPDRRRSYCICDSPSPEAIRLAAQCDNLPVDRITEVRVLDPYGLT
jgi:hypothetical protein